MCIRDSIYTFGLLYLYRLLRDGPSGPEPPIAQATGKPPMATAASATVATGNTLLQTGE